MRRTTYRPLLHHGGNLLLRVRLADALAPQKLPQTLPKSNEDRRRRTHPLPRTRQCNRLHVQSDMEQLLLLRPKGLPP